MSAEQKPYTSFFAGYYPDKLRRSRSRRLWVVSGVLVGLLVVLPLAFVLAVAWGAFGPIPDTRELAHIRHYTASEVYSADSVLLGRYYVENRSNVDLADISPALIDALVATEDARFYTHSGVDTRSMVRVAFKSILMGDEQSGGGSTLSQQLAKNLYPRKSNRWYYLPAAKVREILIARRLEQVYDKPALLNLYLNTVPFGENVFGIAAATARFFGTTPRQIRLEEAAVLVGMLKATTLYNPRRYPDRARERRNVVLAQMVRYDRLDRATADSLQQLPLDLSRYRNITPADGLAPYFRQQLAEELKGWLAAHPGPDGRPYNLYTDGLKIYTTIDARLQRYAEEAVQTHMRSLQRTFDQHWKGRKLWSEKDPGLQRALRQSDRYRSLAAQGRSEAEIMEVMRTPVPMKVWTWEGEVSRDMSPLDSVIHYLSFLQAGFVAMEPRTGYVRAWVGGVNFRQFKYDHVMAQRQVGSTFKPIVYAAALAKGVEPCTYFSNQQVVYPDYKNWSPGNADGQYGGYYSLRGGLTRSVNTVSAALMMQIGVEYASDYAERFGFISPLPHDPSLVLGTADLTLLEMVGAYSAFANRGERAVPVYISRITDSEGREIVAYPVQPRRERVMEDYVADMMNQMLCAVVDSGTGRRLRSTYQLGGPLAGKTGTTQDQTDGWFIGFNPGLVAGAWVGGAERKVHFRTLALGQGAQTALPIYGEFMKRVYADRRYRRIRQADFELPGVSAMQALDCPMFTYEDPYAPKGLDDLMDRIRERQQQRREAREQQYENAPQRPKSRWEQFFERKKRNNR
ncbi:MAG: transglycosylase domain-containing protein [Bacteroidia bacterium]